MSHLPTLGESPPFRHLPTSVLAHLDGAGSDLLSRGWVSTADAQIAVIHRGPRLEVVSTRSNERIAAWTFGTDSAGRHSSRRRDSPEVGQTFEITSCVELFGPSNTGINTIGNVPKSSSGTSTPIESGQQQHHPLQRRLLVVGLASGLVCVFDIRSSRIIRAIQMPHRITALAILGNGGSGYGSAVVGGCNDIGLAGLGLQLRNNLLAEELLFFRGIVAVGTQEGHIYLLDIALDDAEDSRAAGYTPTFLESDETNSAEPYFIDIGSSQNINESGKPSLANTRAAALRRGEHLCIELNESAYTKGKNVFCHTSNSTGKTSHFDEANVVVTALKYVPQLASLLAGFNFGSWQMFNLMQFSNSSIATSASYSSSYDKDNSLPVTAFSFQEPENDPRNFCYIWSVKCDNDWDTEAERISHLESKSTITLYALAYENRDDGGDQYGVLYNGLTQCNKAFDHCLQSESQFMQDVVGSVCIANYTLEPGLARNISSSGATIGLDISELDNSLCNLGISAFLWQCYTKNVNGERVSRHYLGIFDLNAWYQEHMPSYVQLEDGVQCPYFSFCSLEDVLISSNVDANASELQECQGSSNTLTNNLIHVCIDMSTISKYNSLSKVEQHFYPSSLAFELICLMNNGFVYASHLGLQRKVLLELQTRGRSNLVEPDHLFQLCAIAGLVSNDTVASISKQNTNVEQRSALLTVALEHHLVNFLIGCVTQWSDGKYSYAGCTLKFLLEWAWSSVSNMKQHVIDKQTIQLFDWSCAEVNESTRRSLVQSSQQLKHLSIVIGELMKVSSSGVYFQIDYEYTKELHLKHSVTQLINTYLEVILWFVNAGLLPEIPPSIDQNSDNPYPSDLLASKYDSRREEMKSKLQEWDYFNKDTHCLIIDGLCNEMGPEMASNFERESEKRREYPPPNFRSLLLTYLIHKDREFTDGSVDMLNRHRIVQYLFHDMTNTLGDKWNDLIHTLIKFPAAFSVPPSLIKLTHAFWLLDNGDFEEAMVMLLDPLVLGNDISLWQHRAIVVSFLVQDQAKLALKYCKIRQPPQKDMIDVQLQVAVLLANGMVHEAFQFQRQKGRNSEVERIQLLSYFFSKAEALGKLDTILQLPLMISEEAALERYLKEGIEAHTKLRQEVLLMYYLQRSRFSEALNLNEHLERQANLGNNCISDNTRKAIMERYAHRLPALRSKISAKENIDRIKSRNGKFDFPVPLSIALRSSESLPLFNTGDIRDKIDKTTSAYLKIQQNAHQPTTPFRPKQTRKEIGLFQSGNSNLNRVIRNDASKRKYSEISVSVFTTEEINAGEKGVIDDAPGIRTPKRLKNLELEDEFLKNKTPCALRTSKFLSAVADQALSVLSTPTIEKKRPAFFRSDSNIVKAEKTKLDTEHSPRLPTPKHSILKVSRRPIEENELSIEIGSHRHFHSPSKVLDAEKCQDQNDDSEDNEFVTKFGSHHSTTNITNRSRESTPGKSLRFNVPKRLPPISAELNDEMKEDGIENYDPREDGSPGIIAMSDIRSDFKVQNISESSNEIKEPSSECNLNSTQGRKTDIVFLDGQDGNEGVKESQSCPNLPIEQHPMEMDDGSEQNELSRSSNSSFQLKYSKTELYKEESSSMEQIDLDASNDKEECDKNESDVYKEDNEGNHTAKTFKLADISVFQPDNTESHSDTNVSDRIKNIARESLSCFKDPVDIRSRNHEISNLEDIKCKDNLENVVDMSVYETIGDRANQTIDNTMIRQLARDTASSPSKNIEDFDKFDSSSQTLDVPEVSVYEPIGAKEENNLNQTIIRKMAEEVCNKSADLSYTDENKSLRTTDRIITDISIYEKSKNDEEPCDAALIQNLAKNAQSENLSPTLLDKKPGNPDSSHCPVDVSVYIDKDKRISPDPEVTLNFPAVDIQRVNKSTVVTTMVLTKDSDERKIPLDSTKPSDSPRDSCKNANISVFDDNTEDESSANDKFVKSLATKKLRSFDFSNPYEASPAAAAKQRHRSKSDKTEESCSPVFKFSEPISSMNKKTTENTSLEDEEKCGAKIASENSSCIINQSKISKEDDKKSRIMEEEFKNTNTRDSCAKEVKKAESTDLSKHMNVAKFSFSPPLDSLGSKKDITRKDDSPLQDVHQLIVDESSKRPHFDFSEAESLLQCSPNSDIEAMCKENEQDAIIEPRTVLNTKCEKNKETESNFISIQNKTETNSSDDRNVTSNTEIEHQRKEAETKDSVQQKGVRSRSVSPTSHSEDDRIQTPLRRSRRLSERSTTPSREVSEEPIEPEEKLLRSRKITTPKKAGRASPNPKTPRRSRRMSGGTQNEGASVTILETLVEDDEERNDAITNDVEMTIKVDDVLESDVPIIISPKSARITRSRRKAPEELVNETGEPLPSKSDQTDTTSQNTPLRVTRSSSKSSATSSPAKKIGSTKGTRLKSNKPPLKLLKDPFSPQITEEQKEELNKRKEAKKMVPRKKYSAVRKTKSKRI